MWIIRNKNTKEIVKTTHTPLRLDGKVPLDLDPSLEVLVTIDNPIPQYNTETQKVIKTTKEEVGVLEDDPIKLIYDWEIQQLNEQELLEVQAAKRRAFPDIEMWKIKIWLGRNGINPSTIPTVIDQLFTNNSTAAIEAKTRWESVPMCPRDHALVPLLGASLGLDSAAIDAAWPSILAIK